MKKKDWKKGLVKLDPNCDTVYVDPKRPWVTIINGYEMYADGTF